MAKKVKVEPVSNENLASAIDGLAMITTRGFDEAQKKADERFKLIIDRFALVESDVSDIKRTLGPLVQMMAMNDREIGDIKVRLSHVERKIGIK